MSEVQDDSDFAARLIEEQPGSHYYVRLRSYGFEPGETVYKIWPRLLLEELKEAQYSTTYTNPKTLRIKLSKDEAFNVIVQTVSTLFIEDVDREYESGYFPHPNWLVEGWILTSAPNWTGEGMRFRMCLEGFVGETTISEGWFQRVPKNPDPNGSIRWVELP